MAIGDDMTDWTPGQPPPWLAAYGPVPPPIDDSLAGAPGAQDAPATPAPPPMFAPPQPGIGIPASAIDAAVGAAQQQPGPAAPAATAPQPDEPPWLQQPPDAISGAEGRAPASAIAATKDQHQEGLDRSQVLALDPSAPISDRQAAWQRLAPDVRANIVNNADPKQLAAIATSAMSSEELATIGIRHQQAQIHEQSAAQLEAMRKRDEEAAEAWKAHQVATAAGNAAMAQSATEGQALAQEKIDPKEHGVGNFIATVLTGALGGAMSPYTGGRNLALEEMDKATQRRIEAQKANIANKWQALNFKRNLIQEQIARGADEYRAGEVYRIAQYDRATSELQTKMQDYDPQGTTALRAASTIQQIQGARAQAIQSIGQQTFKNTLEAAKVDFDQRKAAQDAADKKAQRELEERSSQRSTWATTRGQDISAQTAANEIAEKRMDRLDKKDVKAIEDWGEKGLGDPATGEPMVTAQGVSMIAQARELAAKGDHAGAAEMRKQAALKYGVKIENKEDATKVQQQIAFAQGMSDLRQRIHGQLEADPSVTNREAWAGIDTDFQNLKIQYIRLNEGKPSSREMDAMSEVFGASPSEINVRLIGQGKLKAHIDHVVDNAINDTSTLLKAKKVEGGWQPTPLTTYKAQPTPADQLETQALAAHPSDMSATDAAADTVKSSVDKATYGLPVLGALELLRGVPGASTAVPLIGATGGAPGGAEQRQAAIEQLGRQAEVSIDPTESQRYLTALKKVAKDGRTKDDRELAQDVLDKFAADRVRHPHDPIEAPTSRLEDDTQSSEAPPPAPNSSEME